MKSIVNRYTLALVLVVGFIILTAQQVFYDGAGSELIIGAWISFVGAAVQYFFGTSASSQTKTSLLAKAGPVDVDPSDVDAGR